ncbi:SusD/RagB family nutrient-binding outer membrane lipoprotein [Pontibacter flavimaris]|uniref:SusD/RagB family nutrient-binding outer membrane lipoprotein n=1 Tax=Pontibacter flavimaris TaxID=1797110 RepID=A0A1Q5PHQ3_9BACT|nr:SusD/RagB family nutrient-binding outer membrane lipoprotein [Pontibacter flavimaris]OKL41737.1 hypothetical protein A3841_11985 [Pontibacter flavimaris]
MKKIFRYMLAFSLMGAVAGLQGCEDYFDKENNPNLVTDPPLPSLLSTTTHKTGINSYLVGNITSYFVQYLASPSQGGSSDTYQVTDYTGTWDALYWAMADIYDMRQLAIEQGATEYVGVANILMAYHLSLVNDMWGDAPYSEAFTNMTLTPGFDDEASLYDVTTQLLDEGIAELQKPDSKVQLIATSDVIHGGSVENWIKTGYALKARQLNKLSGTSSYNPQAVLEAVDNSYTSNEDNAEMGVFETRNPWSAISLSNASLLLGGWLSEQLIQHLNGTSYGVFDPRLEQLADTTASGTYVGTPNGTGNIGPANNTVKDESYISRNSPLTGDESPLIIVSYPEVKLIEAEAAFRAGQMDRAFEAYREGIRASMEMLEVAEADANAYLSSAAVAQSASELTLDRIFQEKYVVTYLNPEAWNDARRHDYQYANFTLPEGAAIPTFIRRVAYPSGEASKNPNTPDVTDLSAPLWWDQ